MASDVSVSLERRQDGHGAKALGYAAGGHTIYVDSVSGVDTNNGLEKLQAVKTLTQAVSLATAGDTIILNPGGSETVTATIAVSKAKLKILCPVSNPAAGFTIQGAGTLDLVTVSAANVHIEGLRFAHTGATSDQSGILTTNAADGLSVVRCAFDDSAITTTFTGAGLEVVNACDNVLVDDCVFKDCQYGVYFVIATGIVCATPTVRNSTFFVGQASSFGIATALTGTGIVRGAQVQSCRFIEATGLGAAAAAAWNGTDGTDATRGPLKFEAACDQYLVSDCKAYSALADGRGFFTLNAINSGALGDVNPEEKQVGTRFWVTKALTSSTVTQAGVDVTGVSTGGSLAIIDVVAKTDATGLAGMTNFELETNNAAGLADFFVTAASGLNATKTVDFAGASVTKIKTVLEVGKKVIAKGSVADGTGAGVCTVSICFERLAPGANIAAA